MCLSIILAFLFLNFKELEPCLWSASWLVTVGYETERDVFQKEDTRYEQFRIKEFRESNTTTRTNLELQQCSKSSRATESLKKVRVTAQTHIWHWNARCAGG